MPVRPLILFAAMAAMALPAAATGIVDRIPGADGGWDYASIDSAGNRLFVSRSDGVMTIDLASRQMLPQFVPGGRVHASFIIPGTGIGVATNGVSNSATLFNAQSGAITASIPTGAKPDAAVWDQRSQQLWVMNADDGTATIIDVKTARAIGSLAIGGALEFAVVDGKGHLFVNVEDKSELVTIDIPGRRVLRRTALTGCEEPTGLALTNRGILIAACANGIAKTVNAATGKTAADIPIGKRPDAVINDPARHRAYVPAGADGNLTVIDTTTASPRAIATIPTQRGSRTGTVDPATGSLYLPAVRYTEVAGGRPKPVPGSFEILVITP